MPHTDATAETARRGPRGLLWAALLIAWVTIATAGIVVLAFHTVSPDHDSSAAPATVPNFVPAPLATVPLAPVPAVSVPLAPAVPLTVTKPAKHSTHTQVAAHPTVHVGAVHTVRTIRTVTTVTSGGTTATGPAGSTPQANTDPGTAVVVIPVTKTGGGAPAQPVTPAGGHPVKVTGVGTTATGEPTTTPVIPPVLLPVNGNGNGNGDSNGGGDSSSGGDSNPPPADSGGDTDPATPPDDDDQGTGCDEGSGHHHHSDNGRHRGEGHAYGRSRSACEDDSD